MQLSRNVLSRQWGHGAAKNLAAALLLLALIASLVPALMISPYARASADDYSYGYHTHIALRQGTSVAAAVWHTVSRDYCTWQGSFSAMALMTLTPCIFSEQAYWITTPVMLASVLLGTFWLLRTLIVRCAKGSRQDWICVAAPLLLLSIQFIPSPHNSFYWWNGAVYYTFTYGVSLLYLERFVSLLLEGGGNWRILVPGCLLGIFVGGSNYVSGLLCLMLGCAAFLWALRARRAPAASAVLLASLAIPFLINMASPGNQVRQSGLTPMSPPAAILAAIARGAVDVISWASWPNLLLCLAWIPLLARLTDTVKFRFPLPGLFLALSFLFFAAQNTPHFYAASTSGPLRLRNIIYLSYYWLLLVNEWYLLGWFRRRFAPHWASALAAGSRFRGLWRGGVALLAALCLICYAPATFAAEAIGELSDGRAVSFALARDSRLPALLDPEQRDPRFAPLSRPAPLLCHTDISTDPNVWMNRALAMFYEKSSVALEPPPD